MMYIAIAAWLFGVGVSYSNGNRRLPTAILVIGAILLFLMWKGVGSYFALAGIAILAAIIWIANKADFS